MTDSRWEPCTGCPAHRSTLLGSCGTNTIQIDLVTGWDIRYHYLITNPSHPEKTISQPIEPNANDSMPGGVGSQSLITV